MAEIFKSMDHDSRVKILKLLCSAKNKRMTVKNICETMEMEQSIVSRHLGILKRSGVLERKNEGGKVFFGLNYNTCTGSMLEKWLGACK
ncbi:MAG TPA: metalloregulator ArsR/SmtB family transcription factor [Bacteroidia bacterium]|nr:metalloregulator ArsR/SmtB family transcription factor [Bacteroidia bacterium]